MNDNQSADYGSRTEKIAMAISAGGLEKANQIATTFLKRLKKKKVEKAVYAKKPTSAKTNARKYKEIDLMMLFIRDGFMDRYTGLRLVIPPSLRVISRIFPKSLLQKRWHKDFTFLLSPPTHPTT